MRLSKTAYHADFAIYAIVLGATTHRHLRHHFSPQPGNFGVTIPLWDYVFGTHIAENRVRPTASLGDPALARLPERLL